MIAVRTNCASGRGTHLGDFNAFKVWLSKGEQYTGGYDENNDEAPKQRRGPELLRDGTCRKAVDFIVINILIIHHFVTHHLGLQSWFSIRAVII